MNIFKKTILTVLASLLVIGNVYADKIKLELKELILHGTLKMLQAILLVLRLS
jgi:hypothetical protein